MYKVNSYEDKFLIYNLSDQENNSCVKVCPERGGIIIGFEVNGTETLYLDKETFYDENSNIRGGIPILFPFCGQLPNQKYELNGMEYNMKNHGVARSYPWEVIETSTSDGAVIKMRLVSNEETYKEYPFEFELIYSYVLKDNVLTINQEYINKSDKEMPVAIGFHPYFEASDKKNIKYDVNATKYLDYNDMKIKDYSNEEMDLTASKESKVMLDHKGNTMSFYLPDLERKFTMDYSGEFKYIVVWSVEGKKFVCVEPWTAKNGALYTKEDLIYIKANQSLKLNLSIKVN
jgi:galactose mutarotase-like enzyme